MENEGIMALPQGAAMPAGQAQEQPSVTSAQSYDAAQTALGMSDPGAQEAVKAAIRESLADEQLSPQELQTFIITFEELSQDPAGYKAARQQLIDNDYVDPEDLPEEYDPEFLGAVLAVLNEMQLMQGQGAMEPMQMSPTVEGLAPIGMAEGGLADVASYLAAQGRNGDSILAHITPKEASLLKRRGGSGTINPVTGLPEFFLKKLFKGIGNAVKSVLKSPIGRILATVALATVLGPTAIGMTLGSAGTAAVASGAVTLAGGGSLKEALVSGAMGYIGGGGTIMGASPLSAVGGYLPGAAGSALNTGLSTGLIGAGIGKLGGMSTQDALRMGLISGGSAAAMQGLGNMRADQAIKDAQFRSDMGGAPASPLPGQPGSDVLVGGKPDITAIEAAGPAGTTGTAQDLLARGNAGSGLKMPPMGPSMSYDPTTGGFKADYSLYNAPTPGPVPGMDGAIGSGVRMPTSPMTGVPGMGDATGSGLRANTNFTSADLARGAGGTGAATNYSLSPVPTSTGAAAQPAGFIDKMVAGAKNLYNEYLSPTRAGLPADAGILTKYGPLALAGTAAVAAAGGMEGEPANQNPAFNRNYTGSDYMKDNPDKFKGGLSSYTKPTTPDNPIVPTPSYGSIPIGAPSTVVPMGVTNSPAGVAQPYNVSGLYGIPIIYGPDGQPRRMAKGGDAQMTNFPRKTGPINGPGTGTSDDIPAMLSDGEFVFTAKAVRNAGGGSRRKGAARMYKLMKKLEGGAVKGK